MINNETFSNLRGPIRFQNTLGRKASDAVDADEVWRSPALPTDYFTVVGCFSPTLAGRS
jgi:hypothetical protein